jgi:hypothetical protein
MRTHVDNALAAPPAPAPAPVPVTDAGAISGTVARRPGSLSLTTTAAVGQRIDGQQHGVRDRHRCGKAAGVPLFIPAGQYNFSSVIELDSVELTGAGVTSILYATDYTHSSIFMRGNGPAVKNLTLAACLSPSRESALGNARGSRSWARRTS